MGQTLIFFLTLALTAPLAGGIFVAIRAIVQFIQGFQGFSLMYEIIAVMDCCLPFSIVQLLNTISLLGSAIATFVLARKIFGIISSLFSPKA